MKNTFLVKAYTLSQIINARQSMLSINLKNCPGKAKIVIENVTLVVLSECNIIHVT